MSILKQNKSVILLYLLLGVVILGNLGCASSNCSQPHPQKTVSETKEKSDITPVDAAVVKIAKLFTGLSGKAKTPTETSASSGTSQNTAQPSRNNDIDIIGYLEKLDVGEIAGNCFDRMFDIHEPVQGLCETVLTTIDDRQVDYEPQNFLTLEQECNVRSMNALLGLLAHFANGGSLRL